MDPPLLPPPDPRTTFVFPRDEYIPSATSLPYSLNSQKLPPRGIIPRTPDHRLRIGASAGHFNRKLSLFSPVDGRSFFRVSNLALLDTDHIPSRHLLTPAFSCAYHIRFPPCHAVLCPSPSPLLVNGSARSSSSNCRIFFPLSP